MINAALILTSLLPNVSYETRAARLPVILAELEAKTGMDLECAPSFKNDVLVIRVENQAPMDLLAKVAQASVGKWVREGKVIRLIPDEDRRKQQESERLVRRQRDIQRMLDQYAQDLKGEYDAARLTALRSALDTSRQSATGRPFSERQTQERTLNPLSRLAMRTLLELGTAQLAALNPGDRLVLSRTPTSRQKPWPKSGELLSEFASDWNVYRTSLGNVHLGWTYLRGQGAIKDHLDSTDRIFFSVGDVLQTTSTMAHVSVVNKEENVAFGASVPLSVPSQPADPIRSPELPEVKLTLDPLTLQLKKALQNSYKWPRPPLTLDPEFVKALRQPSKVEPLSFGSELYLQYAKARKLNLVVWVNDGAFGRGVLFDTPTLAAFDQASRPFMVFDEQGSWLVMTPSLPVEARRGRDDREAAGRLIQSAVNHSQVTFDAKADYIAQRPLGSIDGLGLRLASFLDQEVRASEVAKDEQLLRLYGSLSASQRKALFEGKSISYAGLSSVQRATWENLVYGFGSTQARVRFHEHREFERTSQRIANSIEPTEEWPTGIPSDASLTLRATSGFKLKPEPKDNTYFDEDYDLARQIFFEENPGLIEGDIKEWRRPDTFVPFERRTFTFELAMNAQFFWAGNLEDLKLIGGPAKVNDLPAEVLMAVRAQVDEMKRKQAEGANYRMTLGGTVRRTPPP